MSYTIEARNISSWQKQLKIINSLSLSVSSGELLAVICTSKQEKDQLSKLLSCNLSIASGELYINNCNIKKQNAKENIGFASFDFGLDSDFNLQDNFYLYSNYFGLKKATVQQKINSLTRQFEMENYLELYPEELTSLQLFKALIIRALLPNISILIINEPSLELNPEQRRYLLKQISNNSKNICCIVLSKKISLLEEYCNRVAILNNGKIACIDTPLELIKQYVGCQVAEYHIDKKDLYYHLKKLKNSFNYQVINNKIKIYFDEQQDFSSVVTYLPGKSVTLRPSEFLDVYAKLTGSEGELSA